MSIDHKNLDRDTVDGFGEEWRLFDYADVNKEDLVDIHNQYFHVFPADALTDRAIGFDYGCGSGRWARIIAPKVKKLICIDASEVALGIAKRNLSQFDNVDFIHAKDGVNPLAPNSCDFGFSLGVLHHIPDTARALKDCVSKIKVGAPFLVYLYYALDNRGFLYRLLWQISNVIRRAISPLPFRLKVMFTNLLAVLIYWPLARFALALEKIGMNVESLPLSSYRRRGFYVMKTDSLDRFGTRLEHRFTKAEIRKMMQNAGLENIKFSELVPYWCAVGYKSSS